MRKSVSIFPCDPVAHNNLANALKVAGQFEESIKACNVALELNPRYVTALCSRANALNCLRLTSQALVDFDMALSIEPKNIDALVGKARILIDSDSPHDALPIARIAVQLAPKHLDALVCLAVALILLNQISEALPYLEYVISVNSKHKTAIGWYLRGKLAVCDWRNLNQVIELTAAQVQDGVVSVSPLTLFTCLDKPDIHLLASKKLLSQLFVNNINSSFIHRNYHKIKVAYISSDFRDHPVAYHLVEVIELHDRSLFEILATPSPPQIIAILHKD